MEPDTTADKNPTWRKTGVQGLYQHRNGTFYSRYRMNGTRTFRSLETDVYTIAALKHAERHSTVVEDRQKGTTIHADFRTMGTLATEFRARIAASTVADATKGNYRIWLDRVIQNWPDGDFDRTPVRRVTMDFVVMLRNRLSGASFTITNTKRAKRGYRPASVNQALSALRLVLEIAVEKHALTENPFSKAGALQATVYLQKKTRKPKLPSRAEMERVFDDMAKVHDPKKYNSGRLAFLKKQAQDASEHARFLAYSGMRLEEANAAEIGDDHGETMRVRGTKSESSERTIPVTPALRKLLDQIKARRTKGKFLAVKSSRQALARACARVGVPKLIHHDLRHYFATICIESGVDIPTVSGWLGHSDGGALAMKTYGHLRDEHSRNAAKRVSFAV